MKRLFAIALLLAGAAARAQSDVPQVTAHIQPDSVMIGDRFDLVVDVEKDLVQVVLCRRKLYVQRYGRFD